MTMTTTGKTLLWVLGGVAALGFAGVIFLFGAAGVAIWKNSSEMEKEFAQRKATFNAMTPAQHLEQAREALEKEKDADYCLALLKAVPDGTPGRAELWTAATRKKAQEAAAADKARAEAPKGKP